jgi:hypothetical protein
MALRDFTRAHAFLAQIVPFRDTEPLTGPGEGRGRQHEPPVEALSALIAALNERFGMNLTDADRIWFEQQEANLREDDGVRVVALTNDYQQFKVFLEPLLEGKIVDRQESNDVLFQAFFDKPEFRDYAGLADTEAVRGYSRGLTQRLVQFRDQGGTDTRRSRAAEIPYVRVLDCCREYGRRRRGRAAAAHPTADVDASFGRDGRRPAAHMRAGAGRATCPVLGGGAHGRRP